MATFVITENSPEAEKEGISSKETATTVEESVGTKTDPVCVFPEMVRECMSSDDLCAMSFPHDFSLVQSDIEIPMTTSGGSPTYNLYQSSDNNDAVLEDLQQKSASINNHVQSRKISRSGRHTQRWVTEGNLTNIRLVVGCIPILHNGDVLMVSASKKAEWILPKGGWELDESMEESAIRETFEEAGVVGVLGPKLSEVQYETRKARKKRLCLEDSIKKGKAEIPEGQFSSGWSDMSQLSEDDQLLPERSSEHHPSEDPKLDDSRKPGVHVTFQDSSEASDVALVDGRADLAKLKQEKPVHEDASSESSLTYTHVRLTLFPLYVTEVKQSWPEKRRLRRAMKIDEAITRLEARPEMKSILTELREKGLHLV